MTRTVMIFLASNGFKYKLEYLKIRKTEKPSIKFLHFPLSFTKIKKNVTFYHPYYFNLYINVKVIFPFIK